MTNPTDKSAKVNPISKQRVGGTPTLGRRAAMFRAAQAQGKSTAEIYSPGKGVDFYAYLDANGAFQSEFQGPVDFGATFQAFNLNAPGVMQSGNLQITEDDISIFDHTGEFQWTASDSSGELVSHYADISPLTGNLGSTDMGDMLATPSEFGPGWAVSYGFYDSGSGISGLTNQDQSYVYVTQDLSSWMGILASTMKVAFTQQRFAVLALPGAHDSGMFDPTALAQVIADNAFLVALAGAIGVSLGWLTALSPSSIMRVAINLAMTQKDNITAMLNLGVRYFDFRPGYCYQGLLPGTIYHQHLVVPGYPYQSFLEDVLNWLTVHPTEIVVVSANFQGFANSAMQPSVAALDAVLTAAQQATNTGQTIVPGDKADMMSSYASLIAEKKRLIFLSQIGAPDDTTKYDSYNPSTYATTRTGLINTSA